MSALDDMFDTISSLNTALVDKGGLTFQDTSENEFVLKSIRDLCRCALGQYGVEPKLFGNRALLNINTVLRSNLKESFSVLGKMDTSVLNILNVINQDANSFILRSVLFDSALSNSDDTGLDPRKVVWPLRHPARIVCHPEDWPRMFQIYFDILLSYCPLDVRGGRGGGGGGGEIGGGEDQLVCKEYLEMDAVLILCSKGRQQQEQQQQQQDQQRPAASIWYGPCQWTNPCW